MRVNKFVTDTVRNGEVTNDACAACTLVSHVATLRNATQRNTTHTVYTAKRVEARKSDVETVERHPVHRSVPHPLVARTFRRIASAPIPSSVTFYARARAHACITYCQADAIRYVSFSIVNETNKCTSVLSRETEYFTKDMEESYASFDKGIRE